MPAKKKALKKSVKVTTRRSTKPGFAFAGTPVFGWMVIGIAVGGLLVLLRYLIVSMALPADVYVIEPSLLVPGMAN